MHASLKRCTVLPVGVGFCGWRSCSDGVKGEGLHAQGVLAALNQFGVLMVIPSTPIIEIKHELATGRHGREQTKPATAVEVPIFTFDLTSSCQR